MNLADLFPDEDYRFHLRLGRGRPEDFFAPTPDHATLVAERSRWLRAQSGIYSACLPDGAPLLEETIESLQSWRVLSAEQGRRLTETHPALERCAALGELVEPDFLLLQANARGEFELQCGCVCFPSSWNLAEKIGRPLDFIHGVVPGLNAEIGKSVQSFLGKLAPGTAWLRHNWGVSRSPELNQHPERQLPRLEATVPMEEVWLRVEHQALMALPRTGGVLFGIRISVHPLAAVREDKEAARNLARALQTMPPEMADYKGLAAIRSAVIDFLSL